MKRAIVSVLLLLLAALGSAEVRQGIKPRSDISAYPAHVAREIGRASCRERV